MRLDPRSVFAMLSAMAALALASFASAQERAGYVTTLEGTVTVAHATASEPAPLKFRDPVFVRDRIATGKNSFARVLLGGRAVVTIREFSTVTISEMPGVATVNVGSGRVAVAVARERMRPGDLVEVRTPNAVAGIRGTVIVAEVLNAHHSVITVLKGVIDVTSLSGGNPTGPATVLNALQQVTIGTAVSAPRAITPDVARSMRDAFRTAPPREVPVAITAAVSQAEIERVTRDERLAILRARGAADQRGQGEQASSGISDDGRGVAWAGTNPTSAAPSAASALSTTATSVSGTLSSTTVDRGSWNNGGNWNNGVNRGTGSSKRY